MLDVAVLASSDAPSASRVGKYVMAELQTAPYGSWASPITSDLIATSAIGLGDILADGSDICWVESRPLERGRSVVVRCSPDGGPADVTPPLTAGGQGAFNVRTPVPEYCVGPHFCLGCASGFCV